MGCGQRGGRGERSVSKLVVGTSNPWAKEWVEGDEGRQESCFIRQTGRDSADGCGDNLGIMGVICVDVEAAVVLVVMSSVGVGESRMLVLRAITVSVIVVLMLCGAMVCEVIVGVGAVVGRWSTGELRVDVV